MSRCALRARQGIGDRNRPGDGGSHILSGNVLLPDGRPAPDVKVSYSSADTFGKSTLTVVELEKYLEILPKAPNAERIKTAITDLKKQS